MLLASYGHSEQTRDNLMSYTVGMEEIGADAAIVDPRGDLDGLADFTYAVTEPIRWEGLDAVGVVEMPDDSYFMTVPESVPSELRGLLAASHLVHYLLERDMRTVFLDTATRLGDRREEYARVGRLTLVNAYAGLIHADPIDMLRQSGSPHSETIKAIRMGAGEMLEQLPEVSLFNRLVMRGSEVDLKQLGVSLKLGETKKVRVFLDGTEVKDTSLVLEPAKTGNKPHVCHSCQMAISPRKPRVTIGTEHKQGYNHHHYHAFCGSVALG